MLHTQLDIELASCLPVCMKPNNQLLQSRQLLDLDILLDMQ